MKFRAIKPFNPATKPEDYLTSSLRTDLTALVDGLHRLTLLENLEAFSFEGEIAAGTEVEIRNELSDPPSGRLFIKHSGDPDVLDGDTEWTNDFVYLKNSGAATATVTVIFFR